MLSKISKISKIIFLVQYNAVLVDTIVLVSNLLLMWVLDICIKSYGCCKYIFLPTNPYSPSKKTGFRWGTECGEVLNAPHSFLTYMCLEKGFFWEIIRRKNPPPNLMCGEKGFFSHFFLFWNSPAEKTGKKPSISSGEFYKREKIKSLNRVWFIYK